jgi:hypothetical protein
MEAHMPRKQQSTRKDQQAGKPKPNLGQTEAELEKTSKEQMSHMGGGKSPKPVQRQRSKRRTK